MNYYGGNRGGGRGGYGGGQRQQREQRDNDGVLFLNTKSKSPKAPTFRGSATIAGRSYWVSAWEREARGEPMFSLAFEPKDEDTRRAPERPRQQPRQQSFDDYQAPPQRGNYDRRPMSDPYEGQRPAPRDEGDYGAAPDDLDDSEIPF
jgi:hypothetical protein